MKIVERIKGIDWVAARNAAQKFFVTVGAIGIFAWLPAQAPLYVGITVAGMIPAAVILYHLEKVRGAGR